MTIIRIGVDTSKHVFELHGVDEREQPVLRRRVRRGAVLKLFSALAPTRVGLEACGAAHYWARELTRLGHEVMLVPPQYVKPYVKRGKHDAADAEAICEAMSRPGMRFVPIKSAEQQAMLMLLKGRELLVKQRTMLINAMRGHAGEFGVIAAKGRANAPELVTRAGAAGLPPLVGALLAGLAEQIAALAAKIAALDAEILAWHRANPLSQCLATQPGVGPLAAVTACLKVADPKAFRSGRDFSAWLGATPKEHATAGRHRPGRISRQGDKNLRRLLVLGATAVIRAARPGRTAPWLLRLLARKPKKLAAVALANKMARIMWAMMVSGEVYRRPQTA